SSRRSGTPIPTCCSRRTASASSAATTTSARCTWPTRSSRSSCARGLRSRATAPPRIPIDPGEEDTMSAMTLNILKPTVNNLTLRIFVRAAGLDFEETDVWGQTRTPEFLAKDPAHLTPMIEEGGLPRGSLWESCAIMQYLCNVHGLERF